MRHTARSSAARRGRGQLALWSPPAASGRSFWPRAGPGRRGCGWRGPSRPRRPAAPAASRPTAAAGLQRASRACPRRWPVCRAAGPLLRFFFGLAIAAPVMAFMLTTSRCPTVPFLSRWDGGTRRSAYSTVGNASVLPQRRASPFCRRASCSTSSRGTRRLHLTHPGPLAASPSAARGTGTPVQFVRFSPVAMPWNSRSRSVRVEAENFQYAQIATLGVGSFTVFSTRLGTARAAGLRFQRIERLCRRRARRGEQRNAAAGPAERRSARKPATRRTSRRGSEASSRVLRDIPVSMVSNASGSTPLTFNADRPRGEHDGGRSGAVRPQLTVLVQHDGAPFWRHRPSRIARASVTTSWS